MLPRLQFMVTAVLIAALPWIVFSSGLLPDFFSSSIADYAPHFSPSSVAVSNLNDARQMYLMSYVRRSRELERLRELASAPLSDWVGAPAGEADLAAPAIFGPPTTVTTTELASLPVAAPVIPEDSGVVETQPAAPAPEVAADHRTQPPAEAPVASAAITPQPETQPGPPAEPASVPAPEPPPLAVRESAPSKQAAVQAAAPQEISPPPRATAFVPPLPRERPHIRAKRARHNRPALAQTAPFPPPSPMPSQLFSAPPAGPRDTNDAPERYGEPL
jgi:hypothetical protein